MKFIWKYLVIDYIVTIMSGGVSMYTVWLLTLMKIHSQLTLESFGFVIDASSMEWHMECTLCIWTKIIFNICVACWGFFTLILRSHLFPFCLLRLSLFTAFTFVYWFSRTFADLVPYWYFNLSWDFDAGWDIKSMNAIGRI